jgi:hypothetical protein
LLRPQLLQLLLLLLLWDTQRTVCLLQHKPFLGLRWDGMGVLRCTTTTSYCGPRGLLLLLLLFVLQ